MMRISALSRSSGGPSTSSTQTTAEGFSPRNFSPGGAARRPMRLVWRRNPLAVKVSVGERLRVLALIGGLLRLAASHREIDRSRTYNDGRLPVRLRRARRPSFRSNDPDSSGNVFPDDLTKSACIPPSRRNPRNALLRSMSSIGSWKSAGSKRGVPPIFDPSACCPGGRDPPTARRCDIWNWPGIRCRCR